MSFLKEWLFGSDDFDEDEDLDPILDPIVEKRRKEKFSEPLIYNSEFEEKKEPAPKAVKEEPKKVVEKPKAKPAPAQNKSEEYVMTQIISPFSGLRVSEEEAPIVKKKAIRKKKFRTNNDELIPVISPFYGPEEENEKKDLEETKEYKKFEEPAVSKPAVDETQEVPVVKEEKKEKKEKKNDEVIDSVENRLRNIASLTEETQDDLKIIEERTGKFKLDFKTEEDSLIDEIDDNMSLDELMNLYEKKFKE